MMNKSSGKESHNAIFGGKLGADSGNWRKTGLP